MRRRPRPPDQPVIAPALGARLGVAGLMIAIGTLVAVAWGEDRYGIVVATTMGLVTTALLHVVAAVTWRDPSRSVFHRATIANGRFNLMVGAALALTFVATTLPGLQSIFDTVQLDGDQWRVCFFAVVGFLILVELEKLIVRLVTKEGSR